MQKIIGVTDLQRRFKAVLDEVAEEHVPYVLIRGSQPRAALVPYEEFLRFQEHETRVGLPRSSPATVRRRDRRRGLGHLPGSLKRYAPETPVSVEEMHQAILDEAAAQHRSSTI